MIYYIIAVMTFLTIMIFIKLIRQKKYIVLFLSTPSTFLSYTCLYFYLDANVFNDHCAGLDDCMNEIGLWIVLAILLIVVTFGIFLISVIIDIVFKRS